MTASIVSVVLVEGTVMADKIKCSDCEHRYAVGKSKRCKICQRHNTRRIKHSAHLKATYGIGIEEYDAMFRRQAGKCAICRGGTSKNFLATDHNHKTGEVRGLLCATCNKVLGKFRDDPERFYRAAHYLKSPPSRQVINSRDWSRYADNQ